MTCDPSTWGCHTLLLPRSLPNARLVLVHLLVVAVALSLSGMNAWAQSEPTETEYRLGNGDKVEVTVFGHDDLSGEYTVDGAGNFSMPLIGSVPAKNLTAGELEALIVSMLKPDYLVNPRVSIEVLNYRPFYILGEVEKPGSYPFVDGMTYLNAVAIAGGFTYRAKKSHALVVRAGGDSDDEARVQLDEMVEPGDTIRIAERLF